MPVAKQAVKVKSNRFELKRGGKGARKIDLSPYPSPYPPKRGE